MNEWQEIVFDEINGKGLFKFSYVFKNHTYVECMENDNDNDLFAQDLFIKLQNDKKIKELKVYKSIMEYV